MQKLAAGHNALASAFTTNTEAFLQSMMGMDALLWVMRTAMNDMLNQRVRTATLPSGDVEIDLQAYLALYRAHVEVEAEAAKQPAVVEAASDGPIIFGGDT